MRIDAILPTYNRADYLIHALDNALAAKIPPGVCIRFLVVDNNSTDNTRDVIAKYVDATKNQVAYLFEPKQGKHHALNRGLEQSTAEIVAFFDDDEKIGSNWFEVIAEAFQNEKIDYIAGPVYPEWNNLKPPSWLPLEGYGGVLGIIDNGTECKRYNIKDFLAMPTGGNFAIRRDVLNRCGKYSSDYMYHEDLYIYNRLIGINAVGFYLPDLVLFHLIQEKRLQKSYFRHWAYNEGFNRGRMELDNLTHERAIFGAPLWKWKQALIASYRMFCWGSMSPDRFKAKLDLLQFLGYYFGRNLKFLKTFEVDRS